MTLKFVDSVPEKKPGFSQHRRLDYNKVMAIVDAFHADPRKAALIRCACDEEYASTASLAVTLLRAVKDRGYPIRVHRRGKEVYLAKD